MDDDDDDDILFDVDISAHGQGGTAPAAHPAAPQQQNTYQNNHAAATHVQPASFGAPASQSGMVDPTHGQQATQAYQQQQYQQQLSRRPQANSRSRRSNVGQLSFAPAHGAGLKPISPNRPSQPQQQHHMHTAAAPAAPMNSSLEQQQQQSHDPHPSHAQHHYAAQFAPVQQQSARGTPHMQSHAHATGMLPSQQHAVPEAARSVPGASLAGSAATAAAGGDAHAGRMSAMLQEMTRLANENTVLKDKVKQHAPAAQTVLADNASLRATIEDLQQQLKVKDHEFTKQHERLQEQMHAASEAQRQVESLGTMNAKLRTNSADAVTTATPATPQPNGSGHATLANPAKAPHDSCNARTISTVPCVASLREQHSSYGTAPAALPKQCQSLAHVLLMHAPHSVGILTAAAAACDPQAATAAHAAHAHGLAGPAAARSVWTPVGSTLRAALTGTAASHAVLHRLVEALPEAVSLASRKAASASDDGSHANASEAVTDEAVQGSKRTLGALWLALATVLRHCAADSTTRGPVNAHSIEQANACAQAPVDVDFGKGCGALDSVPAQIKRLEQLVGLSGQAREATENCAKGVNGGGVATNADHIVATNTDHSVAGAAARQPQGVGVSAAVAVEWLQAQSEMHGSVADVSTSNSSMILHIASTVMQPMCETLYIATHETHALELLFSVLMFAEALVDTLDTSQMWCLQPFLFSASFMRALQPPSTRQLHQNCHDISLPHPTPAPGLRRPQGLCPPPEPRVHAIILHTHSTHATACRIWAKCTCSHVLCTAFAALGEEDAEHMDTDVVPIHGADQLTKLASESRGPAMHRQRTNACTAEDDAVSWVDIMDSVKSCANLSQACMDSMLEHAVHLESVDCHCDSVCGSSGSLGSDLDRHTVQKLLESSAGVATAGTRAVFEIVARLADAGCSSQLEYLVMTLTEDSSNSSSRSGRSEQPPDTLLYRLLVVACDALANMYDVARPEASLVQQHAALRSGASMARPRDVGALIRGSSRHHKGLQTLNELLWKRIQFPEEQAPSQEAAFSTKSPHKARRSFGTDMVTGASVPLKRTRDDSQSVETAVDAAAAASLDGAHARGVGNLAKSASAAAAGGVPPPTAAAQAVRAVVWQRILVATEALVLLRRLALMKSSKVPWQKALGQHVLRTLLFDSHCLLRLESVIQRVVAMEHWPPFTYAPVDTGEPWAAPEYSPWACAFLSQHDRHVMQGRAAATTHEKCTVADLTKAAMFWRKQLLHNRPDIYGGKASET